MRRGNVDFKMGFVLLIAGLAGSFFGVQVVKWLRAMGNADLVIQLTYVVFLGVVGGLMFLEGLRANIRAFRGTGEETHGRKQARWKEALPLKMSFPRSGMEVSLVLPLVVGFFVGILAAIMGVGGGFIMVPAMIYLLGMPTQLVVGTSLFQIIFVTANSTLNHAIFNFTVDVVLAIILLIGGVIGAQVGARIGSRLPGEQIRVLLAGIVLLVCGKMLYGLVATPELLYTLGGGH